MRKGVNEKLEVLNISVNKLDFLPSLNTNLINLNCSHNNIKILPTLNNNLKELDCRCNQLNELPYFNLELQCLDCSHNQINCIPPLNKKIIQLFCYSNKLINLPSLSEELKLLNCSHNQLKSLPILHDKLHLLFFDNNNILCEIFYHFIGIPSDDVTSPDYKLYLLKLKKIINKLNRFNSLYYHLKYKNKFRDLLWCKVREPKIKLKYHPNYLIEKLNSHNETDVDKIIDEW